MVVACHCEGTGWRFWADSNLKSKFWGRSIQLDPVGMLTLEFDDGEVFQWSKVLLPSYEETVKSVKIINWKYAITGYHFHLQSHIGQTVL